MFKKMLVPLYTLSSLFVVVSCGGNSPNLSENTGEQQLQATEINGANTDQGLASRDALNPQLADFSRVEATETVAIEEEIDEVLRTSSPLSRFIENGTYIVTALPLRDDVNTQNIVHEYCVEKTQHFSQCIVFDGNTQEANLTGIKYIISSEAFELLPMDEREFWHPQNFEILSGNLLAPGRTPEQEQELARMLLNSYAKTWQTWNSKPYEAEPDAIPRGEARLAWSFSGEGQAREGLFEAMDQALNVNREELRERRQELVELAEPQCGLETFEGGFADFDYIPGVKARNYEDCYGERIEGEPQQIKDLAADPVYKEGVDQGQLTSPIAAPVQAPVQEPVQDPAEEEPAEEEPAEEEPAEEEPAEEEPAEEEPAEEEPAEEEPAEDDEGPIEGILG